MFSLTYIMFPWLMGIASLSSEATIPHSLRESGRDSGAQARPLVTVVFGGTDRQSFFQKHTGGDLWWLKVLECTVFVPVNLISHHQSLVGLVDHHYVTVKFPYVGFMSAKSHS